MKFRLQILLAALPLWAISCATPPPTPPQVYHPASDHSSLVIDSLSGTQSRIIEPTITRDAPDKETLGKIKALQKQPMAVVILENYRESQIGDEFRDRSVAWFVNLRTLGYEHVIFLKGNGAAKPDGLVTLVRYD